MSNREQCISVINSMEEWQLQSVLEMLQAVKGTMDKLESGALETMRLLSTPGGCMKLNRQVRARRWIIVFAGIRALWGEARTVFSGRIVWSLCWRIRLFRG